MNETASESGTPSDVFAPAEPAAARAGREFAALARIDRRHAASEPQRRRHVNQPMITPHEAVALTVALAANPGLLAEGEEDVDRSDLVAALTLVARMRGDLDVLEESLLSIAHGRGLTWQEIAFGLGLGSTQAARQRHERLRGRVAGG
ncbi:DNA-binding protein [Streptomyces qinzhouensis]|uniref:DNA-binding protein n=1 Tax=Streptomyces qinzhouensis TaxID=2599401 RepID=A0A5B8JG92_9ACTN|nr:DNA-binding protein [Streptomyces qinzhouensis]QDY76483.1 DNA-binding protein [Streptomyces qinzhouensis]